MNWLKFPGWCAVVLADIICNVRVAIGTQLAKKADIIRFEIYRILRHLETTSHGKNEQH